MEQNSDSGTSAIENTEEYTPEGTERDSGLSTDVPHMSQVSHLANDKYDNGTRKDEGMRL